MNSFLPPLVHWLALVLFIVVGNISAGAQSIEEIRQDYKEATDQKEKALAGYALAEALYEKKPDEAFEYARKAYDISSQSEDYGLAAESAYMLGQIREKQRNPRNAEIWYKTAVTAAMNGNDPDLLIRAVRKQSKLAIKDRDYRDAYRVVEKAFEYFGQRGKSVSELERLYETQKAQIAREKRTLEREKDMLISELEGLRNEQLRLSSEKEELSLAQETLRSEKEKVEQEISAKEETLDSISREKAKVEQVARAKEREVKSLTRAQLEQEAVLNTEKAAVAEAKLEIERNANQKKLLLLIAGGGGVLALLLFVLFLSTRSAKRSLQDKNRQLDTERQRSDELLLNILPQSIAEELKVSGKAKAQKYPEVTVLFSDFKNFTRIAESLTPEALVEELDTCFKAFDFIISQYPDIEKIKTIGDAYMCASGLSGRRQLPGNIIRAALEMQQFLEDHKSDNIRRNKPYFEARIGLHTGPAVAGVVGVKKFAYDIWGDTVNTAARVESNSKPGRVSISESTWRLIHNKFDCQYLGKVVAKNKGEMDIYSVIQEKPAALTGR